MKKIFSYFFIFLYCSNLYSVNDNLILAESFPEKLSEFEFFLDDYSAFMCNINPRDKFNNNGNNNNMLLDLRRLASRRIKGRLKICTKSIMFEPDDISIPLTRYSFKNMKLEEKLGKEQSDNFNKEVNQCEEWLNDPNITSKDINEKINYFMAHPVIQNFNKNDEEYSEID